MSPAVVVVGPRTIRGPGTVDAERASIALDGIDDRLVLVDDRVMPADQLWRDVLKAAVGDCRDGVVLICPSWWADSRLERVAAAVEFTDATIRRRADVLATGTPLMEIAPELVMVHVDGQRRGVARVGPSAGVIGALVACVAGLGAVTVDVPSGLAAFGAELSQALRRHGIAVTVIDDQAVIRAAQSTVAVAVRSWRGAITPRAAVLAGAVLSVTALVAAAGLGGSTGTVAAQETTWLVEGRVAVEIPARWTVERITAGPGSARVQVTSPSDALAAIQVTQSRVPTQQTLDTTAAALRLALADEPDGVFVDFTAVGERGRRPVVTYREVRSDHHVSWAVLLDRGVRIAIGCQGAPDDVGPEQFCDLAIRSAHAVARK